MDPTVLVVDDRARPRRLLAEELADAGFHVLEADGGKAGWERFRRDAPDLVITDLVMPDMDGIDLLGRIRRDSRVPVIVFTAHASVETAVAALKAGAQEFVAAAEDGLDVLVAMARGCTREARARGGVDLDTLLAGDSAAMQRVRERLRALAPLDEPVLVTGERGTGRDCVASLLHELRGGGAFRKITAADSPKTALPFRGTVYLDEADAFAPEALAAWMERLAVRPGPRFVASAGPTLQGRLARGVAAASFDARLLRFEVTLPPLRERPEDVPRVARTLLARFGAELGRSDLSFEPRALRRLRGESWPGNVAELAGIVEKLAAFTTARVIQRPEVDAVLAEFRLSLASLRDQGAAEERARLVQVLQETRGNVTRAAERLGRSRAAVYRLVERHGVPLRREH